MSLNSFTKARFILCEGEDDKHFLERLIEERGLPEFQVCHAAECNPKKTGGNTGFEPSLKGIEVLSGFDLLKALLIVTDNDDPPRSFRDAQRALTRNGHTAPESPTTVGNIAQKPVAILMIPNANTQGDFEALCLPEVFRKWPTASGCVHTFLTCTGAMQWQKRSSISKAFARSASVGYFEDDPYKGIGHLFKNKTLSTRHTCFDEVANFLQGFDIMCGI